MDKISYETFIKDFPDIKDFDSETVQIWKNRQRYSFIDQMSDVWGEADKCIRLKNNSEEQKLQKQIVIFVNTVNSVLTDPKLTKGTKEELREAEWELLDYCIWDNEWKNKGRSAMGWFDQWMFDYNLLLR